MPLDDPSSWAQGATALKTAFDSVRAAIGMVKEARSLGGGTEQERKAIDNALTIASSTTAIAEAQLAKAFGYELCKCQFPPTPMKTVGYMTSNTERLKAGDAIFECPKCGYNTAGPYAFTRIAPVQLKGSM
jgi:hypothetical protein